VSPEEWAFKISELIKECERDGYDVGMTITGNLAIWLDESRDPAQCAPHTRVEW